VSEEPPNSMIEAYFGWVRQQAADWRTADCLILGEPISTLAYAQQLRLQQERQAESEAEQQPEADE
jgi:hypothetical protein